MRLADVLTVERVMIEAGALSKAELLRRMARLFVGTDGRDAEDAAFLALLAREKLASTGVGSGVAIPHGRMAALDEMRAAVIVCPSGVDFDAIDSKPVTIALGILAPERHTSDHLKALARISRLLRDEQVRTTMIAARDPQALCDLIWREDSVH